MEWYLFCTVCIVAVVFAIKVICDTKGACFASGNRRTDNEKMLWAATEIRLFDWPSKMHAIPYNRGQLREFYVLCLHLIGKFFKHKRSDHLNITLAIVANCITTILLYIVMANYFDSLAGFIVALLFAGCIWPYQTIMVIGHIHVSQMFFMFAVLSIQCSEIFDPQLRSLCLFVGGIFTAISFFSSSSSRKYPPMAFVALMFSLRDYLSLPDALLTKLDSQNNFLLFVVAGIMIWGSGRIFATPIVSLLVSMTHKKWKVSHIYWMSRKTAQVILFVGIFRWLFVNDDHVFYSLGAYFMGSGCIIAFILLPFSTLADNIKRYHSWLNLSSWASHFNAYPDQVKTFGKKLPDNFRGEGLPWVPRFFWRVIPLLVVLYSLSVVVVGYDCFWQSDSIWQDCLIFAFLVMASLLPIIISEGTKSLQVGKSYIPSLVALLLLIGKAIDVLGDMAYGHQISPVYVWGVGGMVVLVQMFLGVRLYFTDVLPARMAPTMLRDRLHALDIKTFYTYDISYNDSFVNAMLYSYPEEFQVEHISRLEEVEDGYIIIPCTSSKSEHMESDTFSATYGDFTEDETLNELYKSKTIEEINVGKFRTRGCSPLFSLEAEVTGYRDLILKQTQDYDRWIAHGWILPAKAVQEFIANNLKPATATS